MSETIIIGNDAANAASETEVVPATNTRLTVRSFGMTDTGKVRDGNEDQFLIAVLLKALRIQGTSVEQPLVQHADESAHLFVVADGMGGHAGGEKASRLAIESVESFLLDTFHWFGQCRGANHDTVLADFQRALGEANAHVLAEAERQRELSGMGTTLTLAYCLRNELFVAHAGDSRCYLCRGGSLYRITRDHTIVEELVRRGGMTPADAAKHRWRHHITNAIGGASSELEVEVHKLSLEPGDRILLCSDGLTEMVPENTIGQVLGDERDPREACQRLVKYANVAGGKDNITVVVAHFDAAVDG